MISFPDFCASWILFLVELISSHYLIHIYFCLSGDLGFHSLCSCHIQADSLLLHHIASILYGKLGVDSERSFNGVLRERLIFLFVIIWLMVYRWYELIFYLQVCLFLLLLYIYIYLYITCKSDLNSPWWDCLVSCHMLHSLNYRNWF